MKCLFVYTLNDYFLTSLIALKTRKCVQTNAHYDFICLNNVSSYLYSSCQKVTIFNARVYISLIFLKYCLLRTRK